VATATVTKAAGPGQEVVPLRHPWRVVSGAIVALVLLLLLIRLGTLNNINYGSITSHLFQGSILQGLLTTIELAVLSQVIGIVLGTILATMRLSKNPVLSSVSWGYIWFFRGTPLIVQVLFWFNGAPQVLGSTISLGPLYQGRTTDVLTVFVAGTLALSLNEAAYMAEVVRAGLLSVDAGQTEAAEALGMSRGLVLRRIVLPQAMRVVIPPTGNEFISMLKNTALIEVLGQVELLGRAQAISSQNGEVFELLVMASIWYLVLTSVAYVGQFYLERHFSRGSLRDLPLTPMQRMRLTRRAPV